jgi:hypothetical protein
MTVVLNDSRITLPEYNKPVPCAETKECKFSLDDRVGFIVAAIVLLLFAR